MGNLQGNVISRPIEMLSSYNESLATDHYWKRESNCEEDLRHPLMSILKLQAVPNNREEEKRISKEMCEISAVT